MKGKKILVTGGTGYIGSHTVVVLSKAGYDVVIADNYANSKPESLSRINELCGKEIDFVLCDLCDKMATEALFAQHNIDTVIHFAGYKSVPESVREPLKYYENNLVSTLNLLEAMQRHKVQKFVFSSSATVYGDPATLPIQEDFPTSAASPYGMTKLMIERILTDAAAADPAMSVALLRYFNPIGAHPSGRIGEDPNGIPGNLVPYIAQVAVGRLDKVRVYGNDYDTKDGTGVRDYIHVVDLAEGHVAALKKLEQSRGTFIYNLGTGIGYSVLEIIEAYRKACGKEIPYVIEPRRPGDVATLYADVTLAKEELGWQAKRTLDDMCADSWRFQQNNPNGYQ